MSVSLLNLRTDVRSWLNTSTVRTPDSDLTSLINMAIRQIARGNDLRFLETTATVSLVAGTAGYPLPTTGGTFSRPLYAYLLDPTDTTQIITLNEVSYEEFRAKWGIATTHDQGTPEDFTILGNSATALIVGATPDQSITLTMNYYVLPTDLSADADHNDVTDYARELVLYKALSLASQFMLEDERAMQFEAQFQAERRRVLNEHGRSRYAARPSPGMIEPH